MKEYNYWEVGMLVGAAIGGVMAVTGFSVTHNALFFITAAIGIAAGIVIGKKIDKKQL